MDGYSKQVEEFASFGDMNDIQKYLKKAQALDAKLQTAQEKVQYNYTYDCYFANSCKFTGFAF